MEEKHKVLLAGISKLRSDAMAMLKKGSRLEGVLRDLDAAADKLRARLAYYRAGKTAKTNTNKAPVTPAAPLPAKTDTAPVTPAAPLPAKADKAPAKTEAPEDPLKATT